MISVSTKQKLQLAEKCFGNDPGVGPAINSELSQTINKGISANIDHRNEEIKGLFTKYKRPENCEYLSVPQVARSIWTSKQTGQEIKDSDKALQLTQAYITHWMIPLVQIMDKLMNSESEESEEIFNLALDSYKLLATGHKDFSVERKSMLMPATAAKYKGLCGEATPITATQLFGDDLEQQIKYLNKAIKFATSC